MKIGYRNSGLCAALILGGLVFAAPKAHAEITLYDKDHWTLKTDGMAQGFYTLTHGDSQPSGGTATPASSNFGGWGTQPGTGGTDGGAFTSSRFRSGWAGGRFNWIATKQVSDQTKISAVLGIAYAISTDNSPTKTNNNWDIRNAHVKIESYWGELLVGRNVGLYTLGAIISTAQTTSAALGYGQACTTGGDDLTCYTSGYGAKFPGFWSGVQYTTPDLGGLHIKLAALDPETAGDSGSTLNGAGPMGTPGPAVSTTYARRPLPMFQTLIRYEGNFGAVKLIPHFDGFWQEVGKEGSSDSLNPMGGGAGVDLVVGGLHLAASGTVEHGTSFYGPLYSKASVIDGAGKLRNGSSFLFMGMYSVGSVVDINAGYGQANISRTDDDKAKAANTNKNQSNLFFGVQYHMYDAFTVMAEADFLNHKYNLGNSQTVQAINLGASFVY